MPSYRFCRPDDLPLLVRAVNECFDVHVPGAPPLTIERLRREMRELDVWPSNSMVAMGGAGGSEPIAVMIGTKREEEVLVHRLGVRPDHRRQGHGVHLLTSLSQKLAVLGPERLIAEVPVDLPAACGLFTAAGYREEGELADWQTGTGPETGGIAAGQPGSSRGGAGPVPDDLVIPVTVADLEASGLLPADGADARLAWGCRSRTLRQSAAGLSGAAIATPERIEAWLVWRSEGGDSTSDAARSRGPLELVAAGCRNPERAELLLGLLVRWLTHRCGRPLCRVGMTAAELPRAALAAAGFTPTRRYLRMAATARPL